MAKSGLNVIDLAALAESATTRGFLWSCASDDLNVNLLAIEASRGIDEHINLEVDVLLVGIAGEGRVFVDEGAHAMGPGDAIVIRKGSRRSIQCTGEQFTYLTCHRRRVGLWPQPLSRTGGVRPGAPGGER